MAIRRSPSSSLRSPRNSARREDNEVSRLEQEQRAEELERAALPPGTMKAGWLRQQVQGLSGFSYSERWVVVAQLKGSQPPRGQLFLYQDKSCANEKGRIALGGGSLSHCTMPTPMPL